MVDSAEPTPKRRRTAMLVMSNPVGGRPRPLPRMGNLSDVLVRCGVRVVQVGRRTPDSVSVGRKNGALLLNLRLWSSSLPLNIVRRPLMVAEFLIRCVALANRIRPDFLITFYNLSAALHRFPYRFSVRKVAWLLDFYHPHFLSATERMFERIGESGWQHADAIIVPTRERLALHLGRRPECIGMTSFVVPNAPNSWHAPSAGASVRGPARDDKAPVRVIYAGTIGSGYGLEALIEAIGTRSQIASLRIYGAKHRDASGKLAPAHQRIEDAIAAANVHGNIEWLAPVPYSQLPDELASADAGFVTYEGTFNLNDRFSAPGKAYDYLQQGLVVITDSESPLAQPLEEHHCGVVFRFPVSADRVRAALEDLGARRHDLPGMKARARKLFDAAYAHDQRIVPLLEFLGIEPARKTE